jgi:Uma2 family endonuclease
MNPLLPPAPDGHARFTRQAYHRLAELGLLSDDARVELIDGEIFMMLPIGPPQGGLITRLTDFFARRLPEELYCRVQLPIVVSDHSEPQPDIAIVGRREDDYRGEHPLSSNVALLIEVSQSSLKFDLGRKLRLYAKSGIVEYWVVDVDQQAVLVHCDPAGERYQSIQTFTSGSTIAPRTVPKCQLELSWLFR